MEMVNKPRRAQAAWIFGATLLGMTFLGVAAHAQGEETIIGGTTQATQDVLPGGGNSLVPADILAGLKLGGKAAANATLQIVPVEGQAFTQALRITTTQKTGETDVVLSVLTVADVKQTDTVHIRYFLRTLQGGTGGKGGAAANLQKADDLTRGGQIFYKGRASAGAQWARYDSPALALRGNKAGSAQFVLYLGGDAQSVEIGGIQVLNYERRLFPHQLPHAAGKSYEGREGNAPWRLAAQARIEQFRKGDLAVHVQDAQGRAVKGAQIKIAMTRQGYGFGTAVSESFFNASEGKPDGDKYRAAIKKYFNLVVLEGGHKWKAWESSQKNRDNTMKTVNWMHENHIAVRGHNLVWPGWTNLPDKLKTQYEKLKAEQGDATAKEYLRTASLNHIVEITTAFKGQLTDWDVVNETTTNHALMDILGEDVLADWFKTARKIEPTIPLFLNEFNNLTGDEKHTENFARTIQLLRDKGAPLSGLGFQGHGNALSIPKVLANFERFSKFNLPMRITEFDTVTPDEQLQADYTRDLMTAFFSIPQSDGFIMWGFWDGAHWLGDAPMFYPDWMLKPSGQVYSNLVFTQWWTNEQGTSDARGDFQTRGFLGDYNVTATANGKTKTIPFTLSKTSAPFKITLP